MAKALYGDASGRPEEEHNVVWRYFTDPSAREAVPGRGP
ncbi:MmyB family transcriptional regulator [Streptomyces capitiformicae]